MIGEKSADTHTPPGFTDEINSNGYMRTWREEVGSELLCPLQLAKIPLKII